MAATVYERQRGQLEAALKAVRPHFSWNVRFDKSEDDQGDMLFIASRNNAGKTWQLSLPTERLDTDDIATLTEEIVEGMDDELSG